MKKENLLTILILAGLIGGALWGHYGLYDAAAAPGALEKATAAYQAAGDLVFIRPLRMLIVPLVFISVVTGVTAIGNPKKLGVVGGATLGYFLCTTLIAVLLGLAIANVVKPGEGVDRSVLEASAQADYQRIEKGVDAMVAPAAGSVPGSSPGTSPGSGAHMGGGSGIGKAFMSVAQDMIPPNIIKAAADGNVLGIVMFAILLGVALALVGERARIAVDALDGVLLALMKIVGWVMWLAPLGVFLIVSARVGAVGLENLAGPLGKYVLCVIGGLLIHLTVILPLILFVFARTNPYKFIWDLRKVILTAFSTASSSATLPVTIEECVTHGGCSKRAATFVPALGATVNMNGTALYEAVAVLFLFQVFGIDLTLSQQAVILVTATLAAVGAPGIPGAGLVTMAIVINAVNTSLRGMAPDAAQLPLWTIGIIIGVDRFLDMCRTTLNVFGDAVGARIMTRIAPDEPGECANAQPA